RITTSWKGCTDLLPLSRASELRDSRIIESARRPLPPPPRWGRAGVGVGPTSAIRAPRAASPPTPTLPHKGGGGSRVGSRYDLRECRSASERERELDGARRTGQAAPATQPFEVLQSLTVSSVIFWF